MKKILMFIVVLVAISLNSDIARSQVKGTISGRVTDASGNGMANVDVKAYGHDNEWIPSSSTDSNGNYSIKVATGTYSVQFKQFPSDGYYAPEWYDKKSYREVADLVTIKASRTTSNINAQLEIGGKISGQVTDALGKGIANVYVGAYDTIFSSWINGSSTDSDGNYSFNMPTGTYIVHFKPLSSSGYYASEWYDNKSNEQIANLVTVTVGETTSNINAQIEIGGKISGRVTYASWMGIANVYVGANDTNCNWMGGSYTDSKGNYNFNMPAGTYKVYFSPPSNGYYPLEWYENKSYFEIADLVTLTAGQTTSNINAQLEIGGKISGRVTDISGNGIASVHINAYDLNQNFINGVYADSKGLYTIPLAAGDYKIGFFPQPDSGNYASEWYNNRSNFESADIVTVSKRNTKFNINAQLEPE